VTKSNRIGLGSALALCIALPACSQNGSNANQATSNAASPADAQIQWNSKVEKQLRDAIANAPALKSYHLLPTVRGDLLDRLHRYTEATAEFTRAAALTQNARERTLLLDAELGSENMHGAALDVGFSRIEA